jgi:type I restriction enzyme S subunit
MDVKSESKPTEIGMIPEDWNLRQLSEIVTFLDGKRRPVKDADRARMRGSIPYYGASGIVDYVNDYLFDEDLILLGEDGENILSRSSRLAFRVSGKTWVNNHAHVLRPNHDINIGFLTDYLESLNYERFNSGTAQPKLNKQSCSGILVALPPTKAEQEAIGEALSDADTLIESLEQLLAKKRHLKQGAMQELLTGRKRLPGFNGKWEVKALHEVCWFQEGPGVRNTQFTVSGIKLLNGTNIFRGILNLDSTDRFISQKEAYGGYAHFLADAGDIVIASSGITIEKFHDKVAVVRDHDLPFCMNTSTIRFKPNSQIAPDFLYQFLTSESFKRSIGGQATGSAQLNFGPSHVAKVLISLPEYAEQTAISEILSDMDAEIAIMETKLTKARDLKQGMMQELLTGRIRLV